MRGRNHQKPIQKYALLALRTSVQLRQWIPRNSPERDPCYEVKNSKGVHNIPQVCEVLTAAHVPLRKQRKKVTIKSRDTNAEQTTLVNSFRTLLKRPQKASIVDGGISSADVCERALHTGDKQGCLSWSCV